MGKERFWIIRFLGRKGLGWLNFCEERFGVVKFLGSKDLRVVRFLLGERFFSYLHERRNK